MRFPYFFQYALVHFLLLWSYVICTYAECSTGIRKPVYNANNFRDWPAYDFFNMFFPEDAYHLSGGYSLLWLMVLYRMGGYYAKYRSFERLSLRKSILLFLVSVSVTMIWKIAFEYFSSYTSHSFPYDLLISYTSPTIVLAGIAVFSFFSKFQIPKTLSAAVKSIGTATLGVNIIHTNRIIYSNFVTPICYPLSSLHTYMIVPALFGITLAVFIICTLIELFRAWLFRVCGVNRLLEKVAGALTKIAVKQS